MSEQEWEENYDEEEEEEEESDEEETGRKHGSSRGKQLKQMTLGKQKQCCQCKKPGVKGASAAGQISS